MRRKTEIKQNEMAVSTCICIAVKGQFSTHPFIALFHWEGFDYEFNKQASDAEEQAKMVVESVFVSFVCKMKRSFSGYHRIEKPWLSEIHIIGGEKATSYLSGTELEVETLRRYLPELCNKYFEIMPESRSFFQNYLTGKDGRSDSKTVTISAQNVVITSDDEPELEERNSTGITDTESFSSEEDEQHKTPFRKRRF